MGTPHKNADVLKAWADGADIQYRCFTSDGQLAIDWEDMSAPGQLSGRVFEYRIKPKLKKFRVVLMGGPGDGATYTMTVNKENDYVPSNFIRWLTDWIEYEV